MLFWIEKNQKITYKKLISDISSNELISYPKVYSDVIKMFRKLLEGNALLDYDSVIYYLNENSEKLIFELTTSGTTSKPKKVNVKLDICLRHIKNDNNNKVWALCYPPSSFAFTQVLFQAFYNKQTVVNCFSEEYSKVIKLIEKQNITNLSCTPSYINMLIISMERKIKSIKSITLGGEILTKRTYDSIKDNFINSKVINIYASTEAGSLLYSNSYLFEIKDKINKKLKIKNNELLIHKSFINTLPKVKLIDEFYSSGDIVKKLDEKKFYFVNRKKSYLNVGGLRINPIEVEELIRKNINSIKDVRVFGKENSVLGSILIAEVICIDMTVKELKKKIKENLPESKRPQMVIIVDQLTLTNSGKKIRR